MRAQGAACFRFPIINRRAGSMPAVRTRKEDNYMEIKCLTQDFPQGKRVYDADGVAPSLMHTAGTMRSQAIMVRGGGQRRER